MFEKDNNVLKSLIVLEQIFVIDYLSKVVNKLKDKIFIKILIKKKMKINNWIKNINRIFILINKNK